jgi:hypothetical protein
MRTAVITTGVAAFIFAIVALPNAASAKVVRCRNCVEVACPKSCTACTVCRNCWDVPCDATGRPKASQKKSLQ